MIHLTPQETALLAVLENNRGKIITRNFLMTSVWGYPSDTRTRTLDVHIQHLRKKFGGSLHIETIYRVGYQLCS